MCELYKVYIFIAVFCLTVSNVNSATWKTIEDKADELAYFEQLAAEPTLHKSLSLKLSERLFDNTENKLIENKRLTLENGITKIRFHQEYMGIPIIGSFVIVDHTPSNGNSVNAKYNINYAKYNINYAKYIANLNIISATTNTLLSEQEVINILKNSFDIKEETELDKAKLYIIKDDSTPVAKIVYLTSSLLMKNKPIRPFALIDATTGKIIKKWNGIHNVAQKIGTGPGGNLKTNEYTFGIDYEKLLVTREANNQCFMKNDYIYTVNLNKGVRGNTPFSYTCPENIVKAVNGAFSPLNDAHFYTTKVFEMFNSWYGVKATPRQLPVKVHYGINYDNAAWTGREVIFGDGNASYYPTTVLDTIAHEVAHAFTDNNAQIFHVGQGAAINESFSDMAGETAEYFLRGQTDWMVGYDFTKGNKPLRYFKDHGRDNLSIKHYRDYKKGMEEHDASGLFNYAFYLLTIKQGWDIRKAFGLMIHANQIYWQMNTNFKDAACGIVSAATDKGLNAIDVIEVFSNVGLNEICKNGIKVKAGIPMTGISGGKHSKYLFYLDIPSGASKLKFQTSKGQGDVDIFVSRTTSFQEQECASTGARTEETCIIETPSRARYYFYMFGSEGYSGVTMKISYNKDGGYYHRIKTYSIPDNTPSGINSFLWVSSTKHYKKASVYVDIEHTDTSELIVSLVDPFGKHYPLHNRVFYVPSKIKRSYQVTLEDPNVYGVWALHVSDRRYFNTGKLKSWSINFY